MIQLTPQMRLLLAVEPVDLRKGIDGLVAVCRQRLAADPLAGGLLAPLLPAQTCQLVEKALRTLQWLMGVIEAKDTTIGRLARMIFGAKTEKTGQLFPQPPPTGYPSAAAAAPPPQRKGHGRTAAADYPGAKPVPVPHPQLRPGDRCPDCKQGKLYLLKRPAQIVRITAQSRFAATRFELEKLRCKLCGKTFTAPAPPEAGLEKYDPNVGPTLGYRRFGGGLPHYRLEPNSGLGQAIHYMLNHWEPLTLFLRQAGAPLDNNGAHAARGMSPIMPPPGLCRAGLSDLDFSGRCGKQLVVGAAYL